MIIHCPTCNIEYDCTPGKYECECGAKFYVDSNGRLFSDDSIPDTIPHEQSIDSDIDKTISPLNGTFKQESSDVTMPGKRNRKPDGRFEIGDMILNRYKVLSELGQGGMGVVYKCFDEIAGIEIALKALPPELSHNTTEMEDVKENFQLVSRLVHQNIAISKNLEKDNATGNYYLIMECVEGEDLRHWIKRKRKDGDLTIDAILPLIRQVAAALDYAHEQKIIHRDIKPGNIMIDQAGHVKVLDFGLAAQIHTSMTRVSMAYHGTSGTAPYMAPEQWRGRAQGAPADQYALAVMTYEMLAGHLPFENTDVTVLREAVLNETAEPLCDIPAPTQLALERGMSKEPADRFESCLDFVSALEGMPVSGPKQIVDVFDDGTSLKGSVFDNKLKKSVVFIVCCAAILIVVLVVLFFISRGRGATLPISASPSTVVLSNGANDTKTSTENQSTYVEIPNKTEWMHEPDDSKKAGALSQPNDAETLYNLGLAYESGDGMTKNYVEAAKCFTKAAEQGYAEAQNALGHCYYDGIGVKVDYAEAMKWYRMAADQGNAEAQYNLGNCYYNGNGVSRNYAEARKWYMKAAEQGLVEVQYNIGLCYQAEKNNGEAVEWWRKAAEQGFVEAQYELGKHYGLSSSEGIKWYTQAAEQGNVKAQYELGSYYFRDYISDYVLAAKWLSMAADQGNLEAKEKYKKAEMLLNAQKDDADGETLYKTGKFYESERNDENEALKWYTRAAEHGSADAQYRLSIYYLRNNTDSIEFRYNESKKWSQKAADQGHAKAQADVAWNYDRNGDYVKAAQWYRKAADQGEANAQYKLGEYFFEGAGVAQDYAEAKKWYQKAANQGYESDDIERKLKIIEIGLKAQNGDIEAQYELGEYYRERFEKMTAAKWYREAANQGHLGAQYGMGMVSEDPKETIKWLRKAADQGYAKAQYELGNVYGNGIIVKKDFAEALKWYRMAANQGYDEAQVSIGSMYSLGHGVKKNPAEAVKWYKKAADQGNVDAQYLLGRSYEEGDGIKKNLTEAIKWYKKAADQGDTLAKDALNRL